jgi:hypothetical protein
MSSSNARDLELKNLADQAKTDFVIVQQHPEKLEEILDRTVKAKENFASDYKEAKEKGLSQTRKDSNKTIDDLLRELQTLRGPEFPAGSPLSLEAASRVSEVKSIINKMTMDPQSEEEARKAWTGLYKYGRGIATNHAVYLQCKQMYYDKLASNYLRYAQGSSDRSEGRDRAILNKVTNGAVNYKPEFVQAICNLLEPKA